MNGKFELTGVCKVKGYSDMMEVVRWTKRKFEEEFDNTPVQMNLVVKDGVITTTIVDETWEWTEEIMNFFKPREIPKEIGEH